VLREFAIYIAELLTGVVISLQSVSTRCGVLSNLSVYLIGLTLRDRLHLFVYRSPVPRSCFPTPKTAFSTTTHKVFIHLVRVKHPLAKNDATGYRIALRGRHSIRKSNLERASVGCSKDRASTDSIRLCFTDYTTSHCTLSPHIPVRFFGAPTNSPQPSLSSPAASLGINTNYTSAMAPSSAPLPGNSPTPIPQP